MALQDLLKAAKSLGLDRNEVIKYVQEAYATLVSRGDLIRLKALQGVTGIKPELPEKLVQEAYAAYYNTEGLGADFLTGELQEITGIRPAKNVMQKVYADHITAGKNVMEVKLMQVRTGIKPELPEEVVQQAYIKYAMKRDLHDFQALQEITRITPSEEAYKTLLRTLMLT